MPHAAPPTPLPRHHPNPHRGVAPALLAAVLGYLLLSAWVYAPAWERAFRSDASPLAWLHRALLHPGTRALRWSGLTVGWLAIGVDQWPEVQPHLPWLPELPPLLATLEEGLEVVAEALVLAALLRQPGRTD